MRIGTRLRRIYEVLEKTYGDLSCPLSHRSPFELLIATILSAQCTDARVNRITPELFRRFPSATALAKARPSVLEGIIKPAGLYHSKAANIIAACRKIDKDFGGVVPDDMERLCSLAGVGRKTANVLLGNAFGIPGFPVDTHVKRLLNLIGAVREASPEKIEREICKLMPPELWTNFSHLLIRHGRVRCRARRPDCQHCEIRALCQYGCRARTKDAQ
ncbi:MAG: endonuclease III [Lentisphaerae bacterium GWF2_52_8]|nr:MAG: endonuclease III [Lentisphaerae bacterium GWF2_52_8]